MRILIVTECLRTGGAQIFALRMLKYLSKEHKVMLYYLHKDLIDKSMVEQFDVNEFIRSSNHIMNLPFKLIDKLLKRLKIPFSLRENSSRNSMYQLAKKEGIELIHSNMFKADNMASQVANKLVIPIIITMHGSYENFLKSTFSNKGEIIPGFVAKLSDHLRRINGIAYLTQKNLDAPNYVKSNSDYFEMPTTKKIYNGFFPNSYEPKTREELGISSQDLVFGMVARAIPEKGWQFAIDAFNELFGPSHLILVGGGELLVELKKASKNERIHFVGFSPNPLEWISIFDVGLLPSIYDESLPNVVVEYLHLNVPVIATDIGETPEMIKTEKGIAGRIIDTTNPANIKEELIYFMNEFNNMNKEEHDHLRKLATMASKKFSMNSCVSSYEEFYTDVLKHEQ